MKACEMHLCVAFCVFWTTSARSSWSWFDQQLLTVNIVSIELDVVIFVIEKSVDNTGVKRCLV